VTYVTCRCQRQIALHATEFHKSVIYLVGNCFCRYPRTLAERVATAPPDSPSQPCMTLENSGSEQNGKRKPFAGPSTSLNTQQLHTHNSFQNPLTETQLPNRNPRVCLSPLPPPKTSYNEHNHILLNICVQFHNYQHPLRISLLKICFEGTQFFIKHTFYSQDTFYKSR
jgi:hypothetical protein